MMPARYPRLPLRQLRSSAALLLVLLSCLGPAHADGKLFGRDDAPLRAPRQRALIAHAGDVELLMVETSLEGEASICGWVIPVPAAPELGALDAKDAEDLFGELEELSQPDPAYCRHYILFGAWLLLSLPWLLLWHIVRHSPQLVSALVLLGWGGTMVGIGVLVLLFGKRADAPGESVEDLPGEELRIHDTTIIRAGEPGALSVWLREHRFRVGPEDEAAIRGYEARGWSFVAATVGAEELKRSGSTVRLDALVLRFPTREIVYPFALTAVGAAPTEVDIHAFADRRLSHGALRVTFAGLAHFGGYRPVDYVDEDEDNDQGQRWPPPDLEGNPRYLTRLEGTLSRGAVPGDLLLEPAPGNDSHRARRWRY